jgi:hypothetical protein
MNLIVDGDFHDHIVFPFSQNLVSILRILPDGPVIHDGTPQFLTHHFGYVTHNFCEIPFQVPNLQEHVLYAALGAKGYLHSVYMRGIGRTADCDRKLPAPRNGDYSWPHGLEPGQDTQLLYDIIGPIDESSMPPANLRALNMPFFVSESHCLLFRQMPL